MSPDRTTITRAEAIRRRKEEEQKRHEKTIERKVSKAKPAPEPRQSTRAGFERPSASRSATAESNQRWRRRYEIGMSMPSGQARRHAEPKTPGISFSVPRIHFGPRWISFFLVIFCFVDLYLMLSVDPFLMHNAEITGNQRVGSQDIQTVLNLENVPVVFMNPEQVQSKILTSFADISAVKVEVKLPSQLVITVDERIPVTAWENKNGKITWVDALGYGFEPRGQVEGLQTIKAEGEPPTPANFDPKQTSGARPFLPVDLSIAIETLASKLPEGASMIFDPMYGLGWSDPQGWKVYLGSSNGDITLKMRVYQSMLGYLSEKNIQPILISVEYPNAPFYQVEQ